MKWENIATKCTVLRASVAHAHEHKTHTATKACTQCSNIHTPEVANGLGTVLRIPPIGPSVHRGLGVDGDTIKEASKGQHTSSGGGDRFTRNLAASKRRSATRTTPKHSP